MYFVYNSSKVLVMVGAHLTADSSFCKLSEIDNPIVWCPVTTSPCSLVKRSPVFPIRIVSLETSTTFIMLYPLMQTMRY